MKIPHEFGTKQDAQMSLAWLDECFTALGNKCDELESRLNSQGETFAGMVTHIIELEEKIKKLQPKPQPKAKK